MATDKAESGDVNNILVGRRFDHGNDEYVITWNDGTHLRATPLSCLTGLTSKTFRIDDIGIVNMRLANT